MFGGGGSGGIQNSKAFKVGMAALTGGASAAGMATLEGAGGGGNAITGMNAMQRRMSSMKQDPQVAVDQGIDALKGAPDDLRAMYAEPLLRAKYYGAKPSTGGIA